MLEIGYLQANASVLTAIERALVVLTYERTKAKRRCTLTGADYKYEKKCNRLTSDSFCVVCDVFTAGICCGRIWIMHRTERLPWGVTFPHRRRIGTTRNLNWRSVNSSETKGIPLTRRSAARAIGSIWDCGCRTAPIMCWR